MAGTRTETKRVTPMGFLIVTDVTSRYEDEELDAYRVQRRYGETLISVIPLYREVLDNE